MNQTILFKKGNFYNLQSKGKWHEFEREINKRVSSDFNFIQLDVIKKMYDNSEYENIHQPSEDILFEGWFNDLCQDDQDKMEQEFLDDSGQTKSEFGGDTEFQEEFKEWLQDQYSNEIQEHYNESENYPMWNTLFEARDEFLSDKIKDNADLIYKELGLGVLYGNDNFNNFIFMSSAGHSFYIEYWMPLYSLVFEWVNLLDYFSVEELKEAGFIKEESD